MYLSFLYLIHLWSAAATVSFVVGEQSLKCPSCLGRYGKRHTVQTNGTRDFLVHIATICCDSVIILRFYAWLCSKTQDQLALNTSIFTIATYTCPYCKLPTSRSWLMNQILELAWHQKMGACSSSSHKSRR